MRHTLKPHLDQPLARKGATPAARSVDDKMFVLRKDRIVACAGRVNNPLKRATRRMHGTADFAVRYDLVSITDIYKYHIRVADQRARLCRAERSDFGVSFMQ